VDASLDAGRAHRRPRFLPLTSQLPTLPISAAVPLPDGEVYRLARFLPAESADDFFHTLQATLAWAQHRVRVFGREHPTPRLCAWYGDPQARYAYSGQALEPLPWTTPLADIRARLEGALGVAFNSVLCNLYRDGADSMGWHSDDEASLGPRPVIASLSFGATRRFVLRHRRRRELGTVDIQLEDGDLLLMAGDTQRCWQHAVPKTLRPVGPRINLTFRQITASV
jgi:alkylated DNA repair dioxygenase AlkB